MKDDVFEEVEIIAKKDKEIEELKHINSQQLDRIKELENNSESTRRMDDSTIADISSKNKRTKSQSLPTQFKRIKFKVFGSDVWQYGKIVNKHKNKSIYSTTEK